MGVKSVFSDGLKSGGFFFFARNVSLGIFFSYPLSSSWVDQGIRFNRRSCHNGVLLHR